MFLHGCPYSPHICRCACGTISATGCNQVDKEKSAWGCNGSEQNNYDLFSLFPFFLPSLNFQPPYHVNCVIIP